MPRFLVLVLAIALSAPASAYAEDVCEDSAVSAVLRLRRLNQERQFRRLTEELGHAIEQLPTEKRASLRVRMARCGVAGLSSCYEPIIRAFERLYEAEHGSLTSNCVTCRDSKFLLLRQKIDDGELTHAHKGVEELIGKLSTDEEKKRFGKLIHNCHTFGGGHCYLNVLARLERKILKPRPWLIEPTKDDPAVCEQSPHCPAGFLTIATASGGADVYHEGVKLGQTPVSKVPLPSGCNEIKVVDEGRGIERIFRVMVSPNRITRLKADLTKKRQAARAP